MSKPKDRRFAAILAFAGAVLPVSGLHKFYLGQQGWGVVYLLLFWASPIARIASAIEGFWYLFQDQEEFDRNFNSLQPQQPGSSAPLVSRSAITTQANLGEPIPIQVGAIADALRQLDQLRQDGLISEYEFEQKRRQLLDRMG
jgi:TM2 domain-containing membrane protein YozV